MAYARWRIFALPMLAIALSMAGMSAAMAQTGGAQQQAPQAPQGTQSFSEQELKSYAVAALEVQRIKQSYQPQMQAADTPEKQQAVQQAATVEMVEAVKKEGLSVEQYNGITAAAQSDPQIASQVRNFMEAAQ